MHKMNACIACQTCCILISNVNGLWSNLFVKSAVHDNSDLHPCLPADLGKLVISGHRQWFVASVKFNLNTWRMPPALGRKNQRQNRTHLTSQT